MENIFYAALALQIAGKPINEGTIREVLKRAGVPVDEDDLTAMAAFVRAIERHKQEKANKDIDERVVKFLIGELSRLHLETEKLTDSLSQFLTKEESRPSVKAETTTLTDQNKSHATALEEHFEANERKSEPTAPHENESPSHTHTHPHTHTHSGSCESVELETATSPKKETEVSIDSEGRYIYCLVECSEKTILGNIGIDRSEVYTIPYEEISAVVHNCPAEPYKSDDQQIMTDWVLSHQHVIDTAWEKFGSVLPLGFDTIIQQKDGADSETNTKKWIEEDYENLKIKFEKIKGKAEYGVQVFWDPKIIAHKVGNESQEIRKMEEEIKSKPKGMAYMYQQKLENLLKGEMEKEADKCFSDFYERINRCVDEIKIEKTKKSEDGRQMLLNFSCLVSKDKYETLGDELEKIDGMEGFSVRFTGPWAPYGFV